MPASTTTRSFRDFESGVCPGCIWRSQFAAPCIEVRHGASAKCRVFAPQLCIEGSVSPEKQNRALQLRPFFVFTLQPMFADQEMVGRLVPEHLDPHQLIGNHHRVDSIGKKVLDALQPRQSFAIDIDKTHVVAEQFDCPARFLAAQLPLIRALLVDNLNLRPAVGSRFFVSAPGFPPVATIRVARRS